MKQMLGSIAVVLLLIAPVATVVVGCGDSGPTEMVQPSDVQQSDPDDVEPEDVGGGDP